MKRFLLPAVLAAILVACLVGWFVTREAASSGVAEKIRRDNPTGLVDDRLLKTAQSLAALADTPDGQASSKEALRLADRDVDQAYATALR